MKILVAEDERIIADSYKLLLESRNHTVILCSDGEQCLNVFDEHAGRMKQRPVLARIKTSTAAISPNSPFDLLILDYRMPKKNGLEVAEQVLSKAPNQRIIIASAYSQEIINSKGLAKNVEILTKPFEFDAFVEMVERGPTGPTGPKQVKQPSTNRPRAGVFSSIAPHRQVMNVDSVDFRFWR